ncbi:MAG TPA: hypothetical protein VIJ97_00850 [Candidatus Anoxymicrobiaceae bacterium]
MSEILEKDGAVGIPNSGREPGDVAAGKAVLRGRLKTPRAAAIAGIIFSLLIALSTVLIKVWFPANLSEAAHWLTDPGMRGVAIFALNVVPFAGIAFVWFIGVIRDHLGEHEDRFFATVFLGSGLLYIAMLFASAAITLGLLSSFHTHSRVLVDPGAWAAGRGAAFALVTVFATRMAAVFTISTATVFLRTRTVPRWLAFSGYAVALVLLFGSNLSEWLSLLFPTWVLLVSLSILKASLAMHRETSQDVEQENA